MRTLPSEERKKPVLFPTTLVGSYPQPDWLIDRTGHPNPVPRIVGGIRRKHPVGVEDVRFLRANTDRLIKITVPGPFTMSQQAQNDHYPSQAHVAMGYAMRSMKKSGICLPPAPMSFRWTNLTCRPDRNRHESTDWKH